MEIFEFPLLLYFVTILFQAWYASRKGETSLWLKWQFSRKEMFIFMQKICVSLSSENTVS